ncbi:PRC-barrel domain-containing protein [Streptomyces lavendofoliae]|uniref:Photosystem reaction center subunit H n=1 Tax=Streptomyces lavendofoliae TaxID=67314 RepID=A0A918HTQ2_9ACTN|nr:PRC-barrel domain-containing protein [Streptomyces lavendofoliae]GGU26316.1 photosystem reaction center subunit H [Streptomyces lavendofoliae]
MIRSADIREWRAHDVIDSSGHKIGTLEAVYVNTSTDEPAMVTVQVGLPTRRHLVFVPLNGAVVGPGYVRVDHDRALVKKCPAIGTDDVLPAEDEAAVFAHYGLPYHPGANGERQLARR